MPTIVLRFAALIALAGLGVAATGVALVPAVRSVASAGSPTIEPDIDLGDLEQRSYVYAADGGMIATFRAEIDRQPVPLESVPDVLVDAVLAVEDADFYSHNGVNLRSTLRALLANVDEGAIIQGGSTITQQLVKQELVGDEMTVDRKAKEAVLAARLERRMSKDEILERYLNTVYFGYGAYGVQAASEVYFGIDVDEIDPPQAALLAAVIANPSRFDPIRQPETAERRRNVALARMEAEGAITTSERRSYERTPLPEHVSRVLPEPDDYFAEEVKRLLLDDERLGETRDERQAAVFRGGLRIHTTLDRRAQLLAQASRDDVLAEVAPEGTRLGTVPLAPNPLTGAERYATAAMVSVEPSTGAVRTMIGGPGFDLFQYNITTQGGRHAGSAFKIFVLLALLEQGVSPRSTVSGAGPCQFNLPEVREPYRVQNFSNSRGGTADLVTQTARSSNCAFVRLGQIAGLDSVVYVARALGITAPLDPAFFSMPLGTAEVLPVEMVAAYAAIANDGVYQKPYLIERVEDRHGNVLFEHEPESHRALSPQTARLAAQILERNVQSGTGTRGRVPGQHAAGKTGTAQGSGDAWFVGFTPYLATAVWMGSPDDRFDVRIHGRGITGGSYPTEIWGRFMRAWHEGFPTVPYEPPGPVGSATHLAVDRAIDPSGQRRPQPPRPAPAQPAPAPQPDGDQEGGGDGGGGGQEGGGGDGGQEGGGGDGGQEGGGGGGGQEGGGGGQPEG